MTPEAIKFVAVIYKLSLTVAVIYKLSFTVAVIYKLSLTVAVIYKPSLTCRHLHADHSGTLHFDIVRELGISKSTAVYGVCGFLMVSLVDTQ